MRICVYCNRYEATPQHTCKSLRQQQELSVYSEKLKYWFLVEEKSIYELEVTSNEWFGKKITGQWLRKWCKLNSIKIKTIKEQSNNKRVREKYKNTVMKLYGVDNVSKSDIIKNKKIEINNNRYGVDNPFQREDVIYKSKEKLFEKYGVTNARYIKSKNRNGQLSKPHKKISEYLNNIGIYHENEKHNLFPKERASNNRIYSPIVDIWIEKYNTVIEIYGDYWHANSKFYFSSDVIHLFSGPTIVEEIWESDKIRINHIKSFGINVIIFWEEDIKNSFDLIKKTLYDLIEG